MPRRRQPCDHGVEDRAAFAGPGGADEEPVLLPDGRGANGVFDEVVVDLDAPVAPIDFQRGPLAQRIIDGLAGQTLREMASAGFEAKESVLEPREDWLALVGAHGDAQV